MNDRLTTEQTSFYQENGFVALEGFRDSAELEEWRRCTDEAVDQRLGGCRLHNQTDPDGY